MAQVEMTAIGRDRVADLHGELAGEVHDGTLRRLVQRGDGVIVVEHSPDLIARADWILDLGPGGGVRGGRLLHSGPLEEFLDHGVSATAAELRRHLRWETSER